MNITETEDHITGLNQKLANLDTDRDKFLTAKSTDEQIAKSQKEMNESKSLLATEKDTLKNLKSKKSESLKFTIIQMEEKISEMLPSGSAVVRIGDNSIDIGWQLPDGIVEYASLSEGQQEIFEKALTRAMLDKGGLLIYEAGPVDSDNLKALMKTIKGKPYQIIINSWKKPPPMKGWTITPR